MSPANSNSAARAQGTRQTSEARARPQRPARPERVEARLPISKIRWDRKFRALMLVVFALVGWIGVGALHALMSTHAQALQEQALVSSLQRENRALARKQASYNEPATIERSARALGMVKSGEKTFAVTGLDGP